MESSELKDFTLQILLLIFAIWLMYTGYHHNKKARAFSWKEFTFFRFNDLFAANALVIGTGIINLLALKLLMGN